MVHIYCGSGKGKTTAALGLAVRSAGAGYPVHIYQFMKGNPTSELESLEKLGIQVRRLSKDYGFSSQMSDGWKWMFRFSSRAERYSSILNESTP